MLSSPRFSNEHFCVTDFGNSKFRIMTRCCVDQQFLLCSSGGNFKFENVPPTNTVLTSQMLWASFFENSNPDLLVVMQLHTTWRRAPSNAAWKQDGKHQRNDVSDFYRSTSIGILAPLFVHLPQARSNKRCEEKNLPLPPAKDPPSSSLVVITHSKKRHTTTALSSRII